MVPPLNQPLLFLIVVALTLRGSCQMPGLITLPNLPLQPTIEKLNLPSISLSWHSTVAC